MIPHRYAIEERVFQRRRRGPITKYRWVIYRVSRDYDGRPVYLRKTMGKRWEYFLYDVKWYGWRKIVNLGDAHKDSYYEVVRIDDASPGAPVTERDALKFLPDMTHGMAALDKLRDLLEEEK